MTKKYSRKRESLTTLLFVLAVFLFMLALVLMVLVSLHVLFLRGFTAGVFVATGVTMLLYVVIRRIEHKLGDPSYVGTTVFAVLLILWGLVGFNVIVA